MRLECSVAPGVAIDQYYVKWRSACDPLRVFYESFPPHLADTTSPISIDGQRYTVDQHDFSLSIREATPTDAAEEYVCELGVEDPQERTRPLVYTRTQTVNLSLSISSKSARMGVLLTSSEYGCGYFMGCSQVDCDTGF